MSKFLLALSQPYLKESGHLLDNSVVGLGSGGLVLAAHGEVHLVDVVEHVLLGGQQLLGGGWRGGGSQGVDVEAESAQEAAELLTAVHPVLLLNSSADFVETGSGLGNTSLSGGGVTSLVETVTGALWQVKVTSLIDDVVATLDRAEVEGVDSRGGSHGRVSSHGGGGGGGNGSRSLGGDGPHNVVLDGGVRGGQGQGPNAAQNEARDDDGHLLQSGHTLRGLSLVQVVVRHIEERRKEKQTEKK
mmetsp:Transcript_49072/g.79825  ORF Transcript_49072/g.79825 Transcript_49072/m.79825 type:complete len:245 (+) Transcript_49072:683-1417(+)